MTAANGLNLSTTGLVYFNATTPAFSSQTTTIHQVQVGAASNAVSGIAVGADHSILMGNSAADPAFTTSGTPYVTGISFDSGSNTLSSYSTGTFSPTLQGATSGGSTTYIAQFGNYTRIGASVTCQIVVTATAATGTGNVTIGALPFTAKNGSANSWCAFLDASAGSTWPVGATSPAITPTVNTTNANIYVSGTATGGGQLQMFNGTTNYQTGLTYLI